MPSAGSALIISDVVRSVAKKFGDKRTFRHEEQVERLGENVERGAVPFSLPMKASQPFQHRVGVCEGRDLLRAEQFGQQQHILESDCHASACHGMSHVCGVTQYE